MGVRVGLFVFLFGFANALHEAVAVHHPAHQLCFNGRADTLDPHFVFGGTPCLQQERPLVGRDDFKAKPVGVVLYFPDGAQDNVANLDPFERVQIPGGPFRFGARPKVVNAVPVHHEPPFVPLLQRHARGGLFVQPSLYQNTRGGLALVLGSVGSMRGNSHISVSDST